VGDVDVIGILLTLAHEIPLREDSLLFDHKR
jgi:hypothetical protein